MTEQKIAIWSIGDRPQYRQIAAIGGIRLHGLTTAAFLLMGPGPQMVWATSELTLGDAVEIALSAKDPTVERFEAAAEALDELAISESQLPEPQFRFGLMNFPFDSLKFGQEPMTQIQVGFRRSFPRGQTLSINRERKQAQAAEQRAGSRLQESRIAYETRSVWLELYYWLGARSAAAKSQSAVAELVDVIEASFATGVQSNRDLIRAELELSLIEDRSIDVERQIEILRAELQRLVGEEASLSDLPSDFPELPLLPARELILDGLTAHPSVGIHDARIELSAREIDFELQQYKPGWSLDVGYGGRSSSRSDLGSAMIVVDLPIFKKNRQDRRVAATRKAQSAARLERDARLLDLRRSLNRTYADWVRLGERINLFDTVVLERSRANATAELDGYQNGVVDFEGLIRSRLAVLDTQLQLRRLRVDRAKAQALLLFLLSGVSR